MINLRKGALRRALCGVLPAALLLTGLAGCGQSAEPAAQDTAATAAVTQAEATPAVNDAIAAAAEGIEEDPSLPQQITYNGADYVLNKDLSTLLFLGIDSEAIAEDRQVVGSGGRADTIMIFVLNKTDKTLRVLELSRDTMTSVDVYNANRKFLYSGTMQIDMQYAFGESTARSCALMKNKVSEVLEDLRINSICSLTVEGLVSVVDAMGGLTLTLDYDYTDIDPAYTAGATITMNGEEAEHFIRYRDITTSGSNDTRMQRHTDLMLELFSTIASYGKVKLTSLYEAAGDQLYTDLTADELAALSEYTLTEVIKIPGETQHGDLHDEYYLDTDAVHELIVQTFYLPA